MNIKTESIEKIVDAALKYYSERLTAYQIAKIVNVGLELLESDATALKPQYVYNATKTIRAKSVDGLLSQSEARAQAIKFLNNLINGAGTKSANLLQLLKLELGSLDDEVLAYQVELDTQE
jgi:hypothetical protein